MYPSPAYKRFVEQVRYEVMVHHKQWKYPIKCPCRMMLWAYPKDRRIRDLDNIQKTVSDALQKAGVIANDSLIVEARQAWGQMSLPPGVEVWLVAVRPNRKLRRPPNAE